MCNAKWIATLFVAFALGSALGACNTTAPSCADEALIHIVFPSDGTGDEGKVTWLSNGIVPVFLKYADGSLKSYVKSVAAEQSLDQIQGTSDPCKNIDLLSSTHRYCFFDVSSAVTRSDFA